MKALSVITLLTILSISCAHEAKNQSSSNSTSDSIVPTFLKQEEAALLLQKEDAKFGVIHSFDDNRKILVSKKSNEWEIYIPDWRKKKIGWYNG